LRIKVKFYASFREVFHTKEVNIQVENGTNIRKLLALLCDSPQRLEELFDNNKLKPFIIVLKNGRHIQHLNGLETDLEEGDNIAIFPPIAGG